MEINFNIEGEDLKFVRDYLKDKENPVDFAEITLQLYNPACEYKVEDLIFKEYQGMIPIGAKKTIDFNRGVVLKVTHARERFGLNEVKLSYEGTSDFLKYIKYLDRQKMY